MKLKSWMDIVRARRAKKKEAKNKDKKGKSDACSGTAAAATSTNCDSTATVSEATSSHSGDAYRQEATAAGREGASSAHIRINRKVVNPSTTFLRCGESASGSPALHTPPYLSVGAGVFSSGYETTLERRTYASSTAAAATCDSPSLYRQSQQANALCQCFGSLGLSGGPEYRECGSRMSPLRHAAYQGSPRPGLSVPLPSQHHHMQEHLQEPNTVNLNSPRQRSKIRTNPWLLTPKVSRVHNSGSQNNNARPLLASMSTSSESCAGSQRDSFVSAGTTTDGDSYEPAPRFPPGPFTPRSGRHQRQRSCATSGSDDDAFLTVRGRPLRELVAGASTCLGGQQQKQQPTIRQCSYSSPATSTPKKGGDPAPCVTPNLLRPESSAPLRKRSLRSSRNRCSANGGSADARHRREAYENGEEEEEDESDECDTLNEMGNFSERYNTYFDRETDILGEEDERDPYLAAVRLRTSKANNSGSLSRGGYFRPPPYAEPPRRPPRDLLRGNDDDYSEKLEFVDVDEAFSEMSGCGSLEEEEEEEEVGEEEEEDDDDEMEGERRMRRIGYGGVTEAVGVTGGGGSQPIRIRIRREVAGSDKTLHLFGTEEGEEEEEGGLECEPSTPDSAFPSSESELSSLMAAGSCCSAESTPLSEWRAASSSGASDSGRSTIHESSTTSSSSGGVERGGGGPGSPSCASLQSSGGGCTTLTQPSRCSHLVAAAEEVRESLEDKVRWLQLERLVVQEKIREAREEERTRHLDRERFRHELASHRRQLLLRTLHELRLKMDEQSMRLQEAYQVTLHAHQHLQQQQQHLPAELARQRRQQREQSSRMSAATAAERRRSWEIVGRLM